MESRQFDYDKRPITFVVGISGSLAASLFFLYAFFEQIDLRLGPIVLPSWSLLLFALGLFGSTAFFVLMALRRRRQPQRIAIGDWGIEVPNSRLSTEHTRIAFTEIDGLIVKELGLGLHIIDIEYRGKQYRIAENLFGDRSEFKEVHEHLRGGLKPGEF